MVIVVLNDEETYSVVDGATVVEVERDIAEDSDVYEDNGSLVAEFTDDAPYLDLEGERPESGNVFIVVLDNGEDFSLLSGCSIVKVDDDYSGDEPLEDGVVLLEL